MTIVKIIGIIIALAYIVDSTDCQGEASMTIGTWLMIYSILGLIAGIIASLFECCGYYCFHVDDSDDISVWGECFFGIASYSIALLVGGGYGLFSLAWNIYGMAMLFSEWNDCSESVSGIWMWSLINCILLYLLIVVMGFRWFMKWHRKKDRKYMSRAP